MAGAVEADFRVFFEKSPGLHLILDSHFFILGATDNYLRATLFRREDIVGQHLFDVLPNDSGDPEATGVRNLRTSLERVVRDGVPDPMSVQKYYVRRPDGELEDRYWSLVNMPVADAGNQVKYILHCVEDVTEFVRLKRAGAKPANLEHLQRERVATMETEILFRSQELGATNQQLKEANEELAMRTAELHDSLQTMETFTYTIAHDLRAPLRALVHFSALIVEDYAPNLDEDGKDRLHRIRNAAERMDRLICDLLKYGQLTHVAVTAVPIALETMVAKVLQDMSSEIQARNAEVDIQRPLPTVIGNIALVDQVLVNLVDNALKFVPPEKTPRIAIQAKSSDGRVRLTISDNGIGIAPAYHGKIFELFARLHKPADYSGTGIGLALVKKAMERMNGKVGVESVPGEGSCFWLDFRASRQ